MISLFLPVSMTTERYAARPENCPGLIFASATTILRKLAIYSNNQRKKMGISNILLIFVFLDPCL